MTPTDLRSATSVDQEPDEVSIKTIRVLQRLYARHAKLSFPGPRYFLGIPLDSPDDEPQPMGHNTQIQPKGGGD